MKRESIVDYFESRLPESDPQATQIVSDTIAVKGLPCISGANLAASAMLVPGALPIAYLFMQGVGNSQHEKAANDYVDRMIAWQRDGQQTDPVTGAITGPVQKMNGQHATGDTLAWAYAQFGWGRARDELIRETDDILLKEPPGIGIDNPRYYGNFGRMLMLAAMVSGDTKYLNAIGKLFFFAALHCKFNAVTGLHSLMKNHNSYDDASHGYNPVCYWMTMTVLNLYRHCDIVFPDLLTPDAHKAALFALATGRDCYKLAKLAKPAIDPATGLQQRPVADMDPDWPAGAVHPMTGSTILGNPSVFGGDAMHTWGLLPLQFCSAEDRQQALVTYNTYDAMRLGDKNWKSQHNMSISLELVANGFPWRRL